MSWSALRHALRLHSKHPVQTATAVATLALGIGSVTAIFTLVNAILLRPLDYPEPDRLARLHQTYETLRTSPNPRLQRIWNRLPVSYLNASDYRRRSRTLAAVGLYSERSVTWVGDEPEQLDAAAVEAELFAVLGVEPALGRVFQAESREAVVVLGHELWQRAFGGERSILGRTLILDGEPHTVIGVMPAGFHVAGGRRDRLWTPLELTDDDLRLRDNQRLEALVRLAPGADLEQARDELARLAGEQAAAYPVTNRGVGARLVPLLDSLVGDSRPVLHLLAAAAAAVLAIACVNVAHLLLAQAGARRGEMAIRLALGAGPGRLAAQTLLESLVLAVAGGALGLLLALQGRRLLLAWIPADLPRVDGVGVDAGVLLFALAVSLATALVCGALPALTRPAAAPARLLRRAPGSASRDRLLTHGGFMVAEIALALTLTAGAALLVQSFLRLSAVDPGFRVAGVLVQEVRLPAWRYPDAAGRQDFSRRLLESLAALPGVRSAALTSKLPFAGPSLVAGFRLPGDAEDEDWTQGRSATLKHVTPAYFETLGIPVVRGRVFRGDGRELMVNETLAAALWPGGEAVGRTLVLFDESWTVTGVAADIRHDGVGNEPGVLMYRPWSARGDGALADALTVVLEVDGEPLALAAGVRRALRDLDTALPVPAATTMERLLDESLGAARARGYLVTLLAAVALALSLIGTYAVTSFTAGQRIRELGVRMALGASASRVRGLVLRRTLALTAIGVALGTAGALAGARLLAGQLHGVAATDPPTLAVAAALTAAAALLAGIPPAVRAGRVDPAVALRHE